MSRQSVRIGAILCFLAVAFGAFGAHAFRTRVSPEMLEIFRTGALYHFLHGLALIAFGSVHARFPEKKANLITACFCVGVVIFSGSLYALALSGQRWLGAITPIGGGFFLLGWAVLAYASNSVNVVAESTP